MQKRIFNCVVYSILFCIFSFLYVYSDDTYEPNDSITSAYGPLTYGTTYQSYISISGDKDYYKISVVAGSRYIVRLSNLAANYNLYIFDRQDEWYGYLVGFSESGGTTSEEVVFIARQTAEYYIRINAASANDWSATQPYYLYIEEQPNVEPYEPNNSITSGYGITAGTTYYGYIGERSQDKDYYKISVVAGSRYIVRLSNLAANYNLYIFDRQDEWYGYLVGFSESGGTTSEEVVFIARQTAEYYIRINAASANDWSATQPYYLYIEEQPNVEPYEPNNSITSGYGITAGTTYYGYIGERSQDKDYYKINALEGTLINVLLSNLPANYNLYLYNSAQSLVSKSENTGTLSESIDYISPKTDTYYILVKGYSANDWSGSLSYSLYVRLLNDPSRIKPKNLTITAKQNGIIELSWEPPSGVSISYYNIYRSLTSDVDKSSQRIATNITQTVYTDTDTVDGQRYYYCVTAWDGETESDISNVVTEIADASPPEISHTPVSTGTMQTAITISARIIDVSHPENVSAKLYYRVTGSGIYYSLLMIKVGETFSATIPSEEVTDLGIDYYIEAKDEPGNTATLPAVNPNENPYKIIVSPLPPSNLTAIAQAGGVIKLSWSAPRSSTTLTYNVYRATYSDVNKNSYKIATGLTDIFWIDTTGIDGQKYYYTVTSVSPFAESEISSIVTEIADASPPVIHHTPVSTALKSAKIRIKSIVSDFSHYVSSVTVYYRIKGSDSYSSLKFTLSSGNTYFCDIPENFVTLDGVEYYIEAIDTCGNIATDPQMNPQTSPYHITVSSFVRIAVSATSDNKIEIPDGSIISIPQGALKKDTFIIIEVPDKIPPLQKGLDKNLITRKIYLSDGTTYFVKNVVLTFPYSEIDVPNEEYEKKLRVYKWEETLERWEYLGGMVDTSLNYVSLETNQFSILAVISDIQPPTLNEVYPKKFASQKPKISAIVSDDGSGIDPNSIIVSLDEENYTYTSKEVSYTDGKIEFVPTKDLPYGEHYFMIDVKDKVGNLATTGKLYFQIAKEAKFGDTFVYPHPVSPGKEIKIKYELSAILNNVKIRFYSLTGELIKELEGSGNIGINEVSWNGKDLYDEEIESGVYICYIFGSDSDGKIVGKKFKIAVWKTK